jgi:UDP-N-acetyl-2-amino-2-deoxyglucuronate dehydrogenase
MLRFALIGCSNIAVKHVEALKQIPEATLVAACDVIEDKARAFGEKYQIRSYQNVHNMLKSEDVDVVSVLTPSGDHATTILEVLPYRRHVLVEKPLALRLDDADAVIRACDLAGIKLFVVKQNRLNRPVQALRRALEQGRFGKLVLGTVRVRWTRSQAYYDASPWRGTWAWDGGVLANQALHHVDMLTWMIGDVDNVMAMTTRRLVSIEAEDTGIACLRFRNGALGIVEATTATRPRDLEGSLSILGEYGSVVIGGFAMDKLLTWSFSDPIPEDDSVFESYGQNPSDFAWNHAEYIRGVVSTIQNGGKALVDGLEARRSLELINAMYESAETGRDVSLRFRPNVCRLGIREETD